VSFLSRWQPLRDEDAHTALVFGFLRHAPTTVALDRWLTSTLGRPVSALPLERSSFWPSLESVVEGSQFTEPELVFEANDGGLLTVVIEVKPGYGMFMLGQLSREVIDVANVTGARRIASVMVGADLGPPASNVGWEEQIRAEAGAKLSFPIEVSLHYSSFAALGSAIEDCGREHPEWAPYAVDVTAQLRRKGLMGYEGAPMLDDLEGLTVPNAVEVYNRTVRAARQFFLQLHGQQAFLDLGFKPPPGWSYRMLRDDPSMTLTEDEVWFTTTVLLSQYDHDDFPERTRAFLAFDLLGSGGEDADMLAGRVSCSKLDDLGAGWFATAIRETAAVDDPLWSEEATYRSATWRFDRRPWHASQPDEDIAWALARLRSACA
jgi:hypothetical protein